MRSTLVLALVCAGCISKGTEIPPLKAGPGVTVDPATQQVSIDTNTVPQLPDCGPNQVVMKNAAGSWACATAAPNASLFAGKAADKYASATAGVADNAAMLNGLTADKYATATNGVADVAASLAGGITPAEVVTRNASGDVPLGSNRTTFSASVCVGPGIIIFGPSGANAAPPGPDANAVICRTALTTTSSSGTYCGATAALNPAFSATEPAGTFTATGYRAAKIKCEGVANCGVTAHMCRVEEVLRSRELGIAPPNGWYSTGATPNGIFNDCVGWTDAPATATYNGSVWTGAPSYTSCSAATQYPILCCR